MNAKLFVGNLSFNVTENELEELFSQHGSVSAVNLMTDKATGRSRGFAFVEMQTREEAQTAIAALNGRDFGGRALTVNIARTREDQRSTSGDRGRRRRSEASADEGNQDTDAR
jgi:RNA recognition motif-containing protein